MSKKGNTVSLTVRPIYYKNEPIPKGISMYAIDQNNVEIVNVTIPNGLRRKTSCCK